MVLSNDSKEYWRCGKNNCERAGTPTPSGLPYLFGGGGGGDGSGDNLGECTSSSMGLRVKSMTSLSSEDDET